MQKTKQNEALARDSSLKTGTTTRYTGALSTEKPHKAVLHESWLQYKAILFA